MPKAAAAADEAAIREQAYYFWEQDGRPTGREMEYWSRAAVALAELTQMATLTKAPPQPSAVTKKTAAPKLKAPPPKLKMAASKVKAAPAKATKPVAKVKPKKK